MGRKCVGWRLSSSRSFFYATCVNSTILSLERASFAMCVRAFFFPCLCYDRAVLSGYVTYFEFFISSIFSCICWRNKEWKKKVVLLCTEMSWRQQCSNPPFIYSAVFLGSWFQQCSSCLLALNFWPLCDMMCMWCLILADVYVCFLIRRCMTKLLTIPSFLVSQDQALYMCTLT